MLRAPSYGFLQILCHKKACREIRGEICGIQAFLKTFEGVVRETREVCLSARQKRQPQS